MFDPIVNWLIYTKALNYNQFVVLIKRMGMINIHTPVALEGAYQSLDRVEPEATKSRVVNKADDSITEHETTDQHK